VAGGIAKSVALVIENQAELKCRTQISAELFTRLFTWTGGLEIV